MTVVMIMTMVTAVMVTMMKGLAETLIVVTEVVMVTAVMVTMEMERMMAVTMA